MISERRLRKRAIRQKKMASHLPVLELIFNHSDVRNVFEYGCGIYSSSFFVNHAESVISVEMNKKAWYDKVKKEIKSEKFNLLFISGLNAIEYFKSTNKNYDLVFVDGDGVLRKDCVYNAFGKADTIAVHDVDLTWKRWKHKGWLDMVVPNDYKVITMKTEEPSTTVYTKNQKLFDELKKEKSVCVKE